MLDQLNGLLGQGAELGQEYLGEYAAPVALVTTGLIGAATILYGLNRCRKQAPARHGSFVKTVEDDSKSKNDAGQSADLQLDETPSLDDQSRQGFGSGIVANGQSFSSSSSSSSQSGSVSSSDEGSDHEDEHANQSGSDNEEKRSLRSGKPF